MPRIIEKTVFTFDELSDRAKEKARDWWRDASSGDNFFAECVIEDFATICDKLGVNIRQRAVKLMNGKTRYEPDVSWSLGYCQGDYAGFDGTYRYKKGAVKAIRDYAPRDNALHAIAERLQAAQAVYFYKLVAVASVSNRGNMQIDVEHDEFRWINIGASEAEIADCFTDLAHWLYKALRDEYEYQNSDENVDEAIRINEYEFDENGNII